MQIANDYHIIKEKLLTAFDLLDSYKFLPCTIGNEKIDLEGIKIHKKNLDDENFTISVCGQINAGKSTLLNYLLFKGEQILTTDPTPCTAKLTSIKYGLTNSANIVFYSKNEWKEIKEKVIEEENNQQITYFEKYLLNDVNNSINKGVEILKIIKDVAFVKTFPDLTTIKDYIAKGGIFTPFVSNIEIIINNDFVKNVIIVDTPGINDINILRSKVTEQWIDKSNAVVYLFYAGAALNIADFDFIDKYLQFIPSEKIVFAINKADTIGDYQDVKSYVENELKNNEDLKQRDLLKNKQVYPISTISALLKNKIKNSIVLDDEENWHLRRIEKKCKSYLENEGYISDLVQSINQNIMNNKGNDILNKAKQTIETICKSKLNETEKLIAQTKNLLQNLYLSQQEIDVKIKQIEEIRNKTDYIINKYENIIRNKSGIYQNSISGKLSNVESKIKTSYEKWLFDNDLSVDKAMKLTGYKLQNFISSEFDNEIKSIIPKEIEEDITDLQEEYKKKIKKLLNEDLKNLIDYFLVPTINLKEILNLANTYLASLNLDDLKENVWGFLWTKKTVTKNNFMKNVNEIIKNFISKVTSEIEATIKNSVKSFLEDTKDGVYKNLSSYENDLNKLRDLKNDKVKSKNEILSQIQSFETELTELKLNDIEIKQYTQWTL